VDDDTTPPRATLTARVLAGVALLLVVGVVAVAVGLVGAGDLFAAVWGGALLTFCEGVLRSLLEPRPGPPPTDREAD